MQLRREMAQLRADFDQLREDNAKMRALIEENQNNLRGLLRQLQQITAQLGGIDRGSINKIANIQTELRQLAAAITAETRAREEADQRVITTVSAEITSALRQSRPNNAGNTTSGAQVRAQGEYTVMRGDTLGAIAQAFGISVQAIKKANNLDDDLIIEGQKLIIPAP
jgi:LysM repeat protein